MQRLRPSRSSEGSEVELALKGMEDRLRPRERDAVVRTRRTKKHRKSSIKLTIGISFSAADTIERGSGSRLKQRNESKAEGAWSYRSRSFRFLSDPRMRYGTSE
ncbi:MAG: hypothetical protein IT290_10485 [Deltaproteobacteria bacterium]|nr:hypothetical protein [Deltaproteobacteria bacterium]